MSNLFPIAAERLFQPQAFLASVDDKIAEGKRTASIYRMPPTGYGFQVLCLIPLYAHGDVGQVLYNEMRRSGRVYMGFGAGGQGSNEFQRQGIVCLIIPADVADLQLHIISAPDAQ